MEEDESWFHRFVQPQAYAWSAPEQPLKLVQRYFKHQTADKALACFGALCQQTQQLFLDFVQGYPNSEQMWWFIVKLLHLARSRGKRVLALIWDRAPWHTSKRIRQWIHAYNQKLSSHARKCATPQRHRDANSCALPTLRNDCWLSQ